METTELDVTTGATLVTDLTDDLRRFCGGRGDGLVNVFVPHATAGVALLETGAGSEADLADAVERLVPRRAAYRHRHGSPGHGGDHVLPAFVAPSVSIPVLDGTPQLGTWQSLVLVDPNGDNPHRRVRLSFLPRLSEGGVHGIDLLIDGFERVGGLVPGLVVGLDPASPARAPGR